MATPAPRLSRILLAAALALAAQAPPLAAMDQEKHDNIVALVHATGGMDMMRRTIDILLPQVIGSMKKLKPDVPAALWVYLQQEGRAEFERSLGELEEPTVAIYDAAFSDEEIKELLAFYQSPVGRKVVATMPQLLQQSLAMGRAWGEQVGRRVVARLREKAKEKGFDL